MKFIIGKLITAVTKSHPARGAWIEILFKALVLTLCLSHPARGAWIEIHQFYG